jgi:hypothetical protein
MYDQVPSYQRVNVREGVSSVADLALIGSAEEVATGLRRYLDAGATDLRADAGADRPRRAPQSVRSRGRNAWRTARFVMGVSAQSDGGVVPKIGQQISVAVNADGSESVAPR